VLPTTNECANQPPQRLNNDDGERRTTNDERRTTNDERRTTNDERRTTNDERRTTNNERRTMSDDRELNRHSATQSHYAFNDFGILLCHNFMQYRTSKPFDRIRSPPPPRCRWLAGWLAGEVDCVW